MSFDFRKNIDSYSTTQSVAPRKRRERPIQIITSSDRT